MEIVKQLVKQGASVDHQDEVVSGLFDDDDQNFSLAIDQILPSMGTLLCTRRRGKVSARRSPFFAKPRYRGSASFSILTGCICCISRQISTSRTAAGLPRFTFAAKTGTTRRAGFFFSTDANPT